MRTARASAAGSLPTRDAAPKKASSTGLFKTSWRPSSPARRPGGARCPGSSSASFGVHSAAASSLTASCACTATSANSTASSPSRARAAGSVRRAAAGAWPTRQNPVACAAVRRLGGDVPGAGQQTEEHGDQCRTHVHQEIEHLFLLIRMNSSHMASIASGRCPAPSGSLYQQGMKPPFGRPRRSTMLRQ